MRRLVACRVVALLVQKFGGTSVADAERIRSVADYVGRVWKRGDRPVVVVSAMGHETDDLLEVAAKVSRTRPGREMDMLITAGERKAMALLCMALHDLGVPADSFTGSQAGVLTNGEHTQAKIVELRPSRVQAALEAGRVPVVGGAQGVSTDEHEVTFLGRGGSDTTAVALAKALGADACELYTDVSGVFSADPRVVPRARRLVKVNYEEMLEMNAAGCPKPAMRSVEFARTHGVRLHVRSSFTWEPGTWVEKESAVEQPIVSAVLSDQSETKLTVAGVPDHPGVAARLFRALADKLVNIDMIEQNVSLHGTTDISFTVPHDDLAMAQQIATEMQSELGASGVFADPDIATVSIVGAGMKTHPGVSATMFEVLAAEGINIEMISTSAIRLTCVVSAAAADRAVVALHKAFGLDTDGSL